MNRAFLAVIYLVLLIGGVAFLGGGLTVEKALNKLVPSNSQIPIASPAVEISYDRSQGYLGPGDRVSFKGESGIISKGYLKDDKAVTPQVLLLDDEGNTILYYEHQKIDVGIVEMISYPQHSEEGKVLILIDGEDIGSILGSEWE